MKRLLFLLMTFMLAVPVLVNGQGNTVTIGDVTGEEVIVHVYRNKTDPFPFIEFSVVVDASSGMERVELREVSGRSTTGGFMIISGVRPAGEIGITQSATYEIQFSKINNYRAYEKAVMDYLRQLPVPEEIIEPELEVEDFVLPAIDESDEVLDLEITPVDIDLSEEEAEPDFSLPETADIAPEQPDYSALRADSNSLLVHVHRNADDIQPFKEFVLFKEIVDGTEEIRIIEVTGLEPSGQFIYMTGFTHTEEEGTRKSSDYDQTAYNIYEYDDYVETVIEFMKRLNKEEFDGDVSTINHNWQELIAEEEAAPEAPKAPEFSPIIVSRRDAKAQKPAAKGPEQVAEELKQDLKHGRYKQPKYKNKYGSRKASKMAGRLSGKKNKTECYRFKK